MKTIIYLAMGAIWLVSKILKKKKQDARAQPQEEVQETYRPIEEVEPIPQQQQEYSQPKGFEDLFKQITSETPSKTINYNEAISTPKSRKPSKRKEEELVAKEDSGSSFERFEEFKIKEEYDNEFVEMFRDDDSIKKAFIASEVFARKY